jgi:coronin-1B/1C/6
MQGGGGPVIVGRHDRPGRFENGTSQIIQGHTGAVLDIEFNPFDDSMMATASEDSSIKLWSIPDDWEPTNVDGIAKKGNNLTDSLLDLEGHAKKVNLIRFHPTAANTLLSASADHTVKVWDIESSSAVSTYGNLNDLTQDIIWDLRGDQIATSNKDKCIRFIDPRTAAESGKIVDAHEGAKSMKLQYMGDSGKVLSTGASKQTGRELKVWDLKMLNKPLTTEAVDTASGAMIPLFDQDSLILYLCGKGDGIIRIYEFEDKSPYMFKLNDGFRSTMPGKGYCMCPKRGLDIMGCETVRIMKVTNSEGIHPLRFIVPRKSDAFQDDIFPDAPAALPAHTCAEWMDGSSKTPVTMSLDPIAMAKANGGGANGAPKKKAFKTVAQLNKEVVVLKKRVEYLEGKLTTAEIEFDRVPTLPEGQ